MNEDHRPISSTTEEFSQWMTDTIDRASTVLLISIGHQTKLFTHLANQQHHTSKTLASCSGLQERYIREWLKGLTTSGICEYDPTSETYWIPAHRSDILTGQHGQRNLALTAQYIPMLAQVEQQIIECFSHGGGVGYEAFPRFTQVVAQQGAQVFDRSLLGEILPLVEGLPQRLTTGIEVLDIGCGSGHALNIMAEAFPASRFTGIDFSDQAIQHGQQEAQRRHNTNLDFLCANLDDFCPISTYDLITAFDTIHDQAHPTHVLSNVFNALRPGGVFLMADIKASSHLVNNLGVPLSTYTYTVSLMHCMTVSLALNGQGLGTAWGCEQAQNMLAQAGFDHIVTTQIDHDPRNYYYIAYKSEK